MSVHVGDGSLREGDDLQIFHFSNMTNVYMTLGGRTSKLCFGVYLNQHNEKKGKEKNI